MTLMTLKMRKAWAAKFWFQVSQHTYCECEHMERILRMVDENDPLTVIQLFTTLYEVWS